MATVAPMHFDVNTLRNQVMATYGSVAREPSAHYHFHRGPAYAHDFLGYDADELAALPAVSTARFAGVGNPLAIADIAPGSIVPVVRAWTCCWPRDGWGRTAAPSALT